MNKEELIKALIDAGLRPEDLMDEHAHAEAAAKEKQEAQIKAARTAAAKALLDYVKTINPDIPLGDEDIGLLENTLIDAEKTIRAIKVPKTRGKENNIDPIEKFLGRMGW